MVKLFPYFPIFPGTRISVPNKHVRAKRIRNQALSCLKRHGIINNQIYLVIKLPVASVYFLCNNCKSPVESFKARLTLTGPPIFSLSLSPLSVFFHPLPTTWVRVKLLRPRTQRSFMSAVVKHLGTFIPLISFVITPLANTTTLHLLRVFFLIPLTFSRRRLIARLSRNVILGPTIHRFRDR